MSPQNRPDLQWRRYGQTPTWYAYQQAAGGRVWVLLYQERTGATYEHLCSQPQRAGRWVGMFAQQNP